WRIATLARQKTVPFTLGLALAARPLQGLSFRRLGELAAAHRRASAYLRSVQCASKSPRMPNQASRAPMFFRSSSSDREATPHILRTLAAASSALLALSQNLNSLSLHFKAAC